jgi:hypothetical protein
MREEWIAQKVKKLLALAAKAGTPDEAASAAAMAQRLMLEHKPTEADLSGLVDSSETISEEWLAGDTGIFTKLRMSWKQRLVNGIDKLKVELLRGSNLSRQADEADWPRV